MQREVAAGEGGTVFCPEDPSIVSCLSHSLDVRRWTSYQTSLSRGILISET